MAASWLRRVIQQAPSDEATPGRKVTIRPAVRLQLEVLEGRLAPAAWLPQGPAPTLNGQTGATDRRVSGAIQAIAPHPSNANIMYVGAVNGGVWRTANATAAFPTWTPLTDNLPSLSIGTVSLDPATPTTILAGTGRFSSYGFTGDDLVGLYFSRNSGTSWSQFNATLLLNQNFRASVVRGNTLLAASTNGGLFRSLDGGATWANISGQNNLPAGGIIEMVGDRANPQRIYVASRAGVFRSDNLGNTWTDISSGVTGLGGTTDNIKMAVHNSAGNNVVYIAFSNNGQLNGVFRSTNQGGAWTATDVPTVNQGMQGSIHLSLAAHPTNPSLFFVGGDSSPNTYGNVVRIDASAASGAQITSIVNAGASNTAPHADSRGMTFDAAGTLFEIDDGGIYRHSNATGTGTWSSAIGNIAVTEIHNIAYNSLSNTSLIGTQDNGTHQQTLSGNSPWQHAFGGDGGDVAIDNVSRAGSNQFVRYLSAQLLLGFTRQVVNATTFAVVSSTAINTNVINDAQFTTPFEINTINPLRIIIGGGNRIYESMDQGNTITAITGSPGVNHNALIYGGRIGAATNPDLIYAADNATVHIRTTAAGAFTATTALPTGATYISDLTVDLDNWRRVFAVDTNQVFMSSNAGTTWQDVTGNLAAIPGNQMAIESVEFIPGATTDAIVVGTRSGVYAMRLNTIGTWFKLGTALPNILVYDMEYNRTDDMLVAGTFGRGAWAYPSASRNLVGGGGGGGGTATPGLQLGFTENNETSDTATRLGTLAGTLTMPAQSILTSRLRLPDYDWFTVTAGTSGTFSVTHRVNGGGPLEVYLYYKTGNNFLVRLGGATVRSGQTRTLTARVTEGMELYVQVKGSPIAPGLMAQGTYALDFAL